MEAQAEFGDWIEFEDELEGTLVVQAEYEDDKEVVTGPITERYNQCWFARLSEPGYLDKTEWLGPYHTEDGALYGLYEQHGSDDSETFFDFIGEDKYIVEGTLRLAGHNNDLYGRPLGEDPPAEIWLGTLGDIDLDEETGETIEYDPNDDPDLPEEYGFRLIDLEPKKGMDAPYYGIDDSPAELLYRLACAKRDSEHYITVEMYVGFTDHSWTTRTMELPAEWPDEKIAEVAEAEVRKLYDSEKVDQANGLRLQLDMPAVAFIGVYNLGGEAIEWSEIDTYGGTIPDDLEKYVL